MRLTYFFVFLVASMTGASPVLAANFQIKAPGRNNATYIAQAERYYQNVSSYWFGKPHPNLWKPVQMTIREGRIGCGGVTSFNMYTNEKTGKRHAYGFVMTVQGSRQRIYDSVIPHEVNHVVFYAQFRRPLPRYFDEGAATLWEHPIELAKQRMVIRANLHRLVPSKQWMNQTEYPKDMSRVLLFYAQGYMVTKALVDRFGPAKFVAFLADDGKPSSKFSKHFGMTPDAFDAFCVAKYREEYASGRHTRTRQRVPVAQVLLAPRRLDRVVIVFQADFDCPPCAAFKADLRNNEFRGKGIKFIQVTRGTKEYDKYEKELKARLGHGVKNYPSFWVYKTNGVRAGYSGSKSFLDFLLLIPRAIISLLGGVVGPGPGTYVPPGTTTPEIARGTVGDLLELKTHVLQLKNASILEKIALAKKLKEDRRKITGDVVALRKSIKEHGGIVGTLHASLKEHGGIVDTLKKEVVSHATALLGHSSKLEGLKSHASNLKLLKKDVTEFREAIGPVAKLKAGVKLIKDGKAERVALKKSHDSQNGLSGAGLALAIASTLAAAAAGRHVRHTAGKFDKVDTQSGPASPDEPQEPTVETTHSNTIEL